MLYMQAQDSVKCERTAVDFKQYVVDTLYIINHVNITWMQLKAKLQINKEKNSRPVRQTLLFLFPTN